MDKLTVSTASLICEACIDANMLNNGTCIKPPEQLGFCGGKEACEVGLGFVTRKMARGLMPGTLINVESSDRATIVGETISDHKSQIIFRNGRTLSSVLEELSPLTKMDYRTISANLLKEL